MYSIPIINPSKELEDSIIFFPVILKKSELNSEEIIEFSDTETKILIEKTIKDNYYLRIYYSKISKEKNSKEYEIKFKKDETEYILKISTKKNIYFAFKTELEKKKFFRN